MYKILIMDDERQIREGIMKIIPWEQYGFKICAEAIKRGARELKKLNSTGPHVVFVDIRMPVMDGHRISAGTAEEETSLRDGRAEWI
mgnify:CR=1 FL=1